MSEWVATAISIGMAGVAGPAMAEATAEATAHQLSLLSNQLEQHGVVLAKPAPADAPRQGR